jgi:hypothetical protein
LIQHATIAKQQLRVPSARRLQGSRLVNTEHSVTPASPDGQTAGATEGKCCRGAALFAVLAWLVAVNVPFLVGHPLRDPASSSVMRSLAINLVLFIAPGLACVGPRRGVSWSSWLELLRVMLVSLAVFLGLLGLFQLTGRPITAGGMWNATWIVTNVLLVIRWICRGPVSCLLAGKNSTWLTASGLFLASYGLFFYGAINVVPLHFDHDIDTQGPAYGLLNRFEPLMITDRDTLYYFAHPPLFHFYVGGSFLYYDQMDHLVRYDQISQRAQRAIAGVPFALPPSPLLAGEPGRWSEHYVVGVDGSDYLLQPPRPDGSTRIPVRHYETQAIFSHYVKSPKKLENRTPTLFLAALTVAILAQWTAQMSGRWWLGLLMAAAYATSPEVFVRSGYGGFFAISNFAVIMILIAQVDWEHNRAHAWANCAAAGVFTALANHKLLPLPAALALWNVLRSLPPQNFKQLTAKAFHPAMVGFVFGTGIFWCHGFAVDFHEFWIDHIRYHIIDRIVHESQFTTYGPYPSVLGLWKELWEHTGYAVLPVGFLTLVAASFSAKTRAIDGREPVDSRSWLVWFLVLAVAFSVVDWRMTKHLMPLMLPLHLAPALWAAESRRKCCMIALVFFAVVIWNVVTLRSLADDFEAFPIVPTW